MLSRPPACCHASAARRRTAGRPTPKRELEPRRFRYWRFFWDYAGGPITDQGTHLMDVAQWFTGTSAPLSAVCFGQTNKTIGSEMPDVFCAVFEYPRHMVTWTLDYCNSYQNGWSIEFQGDAGTLQLEVAGFRLYKEPWAQPENRKPAIQVSGSLPVEPHVENFLECIRSRREPNAPIEVGAAALLCLPKPGSRPGGFIAKRRLKLNDPLRMASNPHSPTPRLTRREILCRDRVQSRTGLFGSIHPALVSPVQSTPPFSRQPERQVGR